jgi:hypothetical protein
MPSAKFDEAVSRNKAKRERAGEGYKSGKNRGCHTKSDAVEDEISQLA